MFLLFATGLESILTIKHQIVRFLLMTFSSLDGPIVRLICHGIVVKLALLGSHKTNFEHSSMLSRCNVGTFLNRC